MRRLAYLFPAFPVLHQTFTVGEVLGLKRRGYDLRLISLKPARPDLQQPEARALIGETMYCPRLVSPAIWRVFLRALATRPGDLARLLGHVWRAWCGGRVKGRGKGHQRADTFSQVVGQSGQNFLVNTFPCPCRGASSGLLRPSVFAF